MIGDSRLSCDGRLRAWLLAGVALILLIACPAAAQDVLTMQTPASASAAPDPDGLAPKSFYLEADTVVRDDDNHTVTAEGQVEVRYHGRTLRAQTLTYDTASGAVSAKGDVVVINADGTAEFAREVVLDQDLSAGVALGFSARLKDNVKLAADSVIRRSVDVTELNRAIYTPCDICSEAGKPKPPTWSIQADKVIQDKQHHVIYYQHAVIRILGTPVFYAPVFWHPDSEAKAQSGFLAPSIQLSRKRGLSYEQPYVWAISRSQDLVLSPIINTNVNPFLNLEYRKRFYTGAIDARLGYTYEREFDNDGHDIPGSALTSRSYVLASGVWDLTSQWTWGFAAERASDDLLFDRYDIQGVYDRRGLYETDSRRLLSQIYVVRQDQQSYLTVSALDFQGLRQEDVNAAMPVVAPLIEARYEPRSDVLGGRLRFTGSAVMLNRDQALNEPAGTPGVDSHRATAQIDWRRAFTLKNGLRIEPFLAGRGDVYNVSDLTPGAPSETITRGLGSVGVDLSYPLIRPTSDGAIVLEPLIEGILSPNARPNPDIPNVDSADFAFDETNLFDPNRAPGFDVYDSGARLNAGGRATVDWGGGQQVRVFVGRSFRSQPNYTLPAFSGYKARSSDWIIDATATPVKGLSLYGRTQLDGDNLSLRRQELGANFILPFIQGYARYLHDYTDPAGEQENVEGAGDIFFTKHWGVVLYGMRDLQKHVWARRDIGLLYQDECTRIEVVYHHEAAFQRLGGPSDSIQVRLTLATLGEQGYRNESQR